VTAGDGRSNLPEVSSGAGRCIGLRSRLHRVCALPRWGSPDDCHRRRL